MFKTIANIATRKSAGTSQQEANAAGPRPGSVAPGPSREQIARRAREIWLGSGCLAGRDDENWRQAEAQLRQEMAGR